MKAAGRAMQQAPTFGRRLGLVVRSWSADDMVKGSPEGSGADRGVEDAERAWTQTFLQRYRML